MNASELPTLRKQIRSLWEQGLDTVDMARALQVPEHEIERQLHVVLDKRRAVIGSLGAAVEPRPSQSDEGQEQRSSP